MARARVMIESHCPVVCRFRLVCPEGRQAGIAPLFAEGKYSSVRECFFYDGMRAKLVRMCGDLPDDPETLRELVDERLGMEAT